jgi:phage-related minor tail protein
MSALDEIVCKQIFITDPAITSCKTFFSSLKPDVKGKIITFATSKADKTFKAIDDAVQVLPSLIDDIKGVETKVNDIYPDIQSALTTFKTIPDDLKDAKKFINDLKDTPKKINSFIVIQIILSILMLFLLVIILLLK